MNITMNLTLEEEQQAWAALETYNRQRQARGQDPITLEVYLHMLLRFALEDRAKAERVSM